MTWVLLSLMYSFSTQSARIAAVLPQPRAVLSSASEVRAGAKPGTAPDVPFTLSIGGVAYKWDTIGLFVLPGESRTFKVVSSDREGGFEWSASGGLFTGAEERTKRYVAPSEPGLYRLRIRRDKRSKSVNVFVMIPFRHQTSVNGYTIGSYPSRSHFAKLSLPPGFIEVNQVTRNVWVSPHFRLRDFVGAGAAGSPKHIVLRERLIRKLEALVDRMRRAGYRCNGFGVISGYRTPSFNAANGNVENSVHTYGGAADIIVDENRDGAMDDLNRDGKRDVQDAIALYKVVEQLEKERPEFSGGAGYYSSGGPHGAFVHVDVRGVRSRWQN